MITKDKTPKYLYNSGFTLIEVMIVVVILGVLIAIAIPVFSNTANNAETIICRSNQYQIRWAEEAYYIMYGVHTDEYINLTAIPDDSAIMQFFNDHMDVKCPGDGGGYYWDVRDGVTMIFCSEHGTVNAPVIDAPPPISVTLQLYEELSQNYPDEAILYIEYSENRQDTTMSNDNVIGTDQDDNIRLRGGNDLIDAGAGNDRIVGNNGNDSIFGGEGDDYLKGGAGSDILSGGAGSDTLNGNSGNDLVVYDKDISEYEIVEYRNNRFHITDIETGEVDNVLNVEQFQFGDNDPIDKDDL